MCVHYLGNLSPSPPKDFRLWIFHDRSDFAVNSWRTDMKPTFRVRIHRSKFLSIWVSFRLYKHLWVYVFSIRKYRIKNLKEYLIKKFLRQILCVVLASPELSVVAQAGLELTMYLPQPPTCVPQ
jgi:hypothetical protein